MTLSAIAGPNAPAALPPTQPSLVGRSRACLTNDKAMGRGRWKLEPVVIRAHARIGANSTILPGVTIGADAVVGAGAVVSKDVAPRTVVAGNHARVLRRVRARERARRR